MRAGVPEALSLHASGLLLRRQTGIGSPRKVCVAGEVPQLLFGRFEVEPQSGAHGQGLVGTRRRGDGSSEGSSEHLRPGKRDFTQPRQIELGVGRRGVETAMTKHVGGLLEAGALLHHAAGHGVPEDVGAGERRVDRPPAKCAGHDTRDGSARNGLAAVNSPNDTITATRRISEVDGFRTEPRPLCVTHLQ